MRCVCVCVCVRVCVCVCLKARASGPRVGASYRLLNLLGWTFMNDLQRLTLGCCVCVCLCVCLCVCVCLPSASSDCLAAPGTAGSGTCFLATRPGDTWHGAPLLSSASLWMSVCVCVCVMRLTVNVQICSCVCVCVCVSVLAMCLCASCPAL